MSERIIVGETEFTLSNLPAPMVTYSGEAREWRRMRITATVDAAKASFRPDITYRREWDSLVTDAEGNVTTETYTEDLSAYCVTGDVIDHRDGTVTVLMGKKTREETLVEALEALGVTVYE